MKTLCIMVLRNGVSMTKPAVKSILAQTEHCDILLIDNASSDGTAAWLKTLRDPIMTLCLTEQTPLAKAWNLGLKTAFLTLKCDAAWVVNNDVLFRPDTLHWLNADPRPFVTGVGVNTEEQLNADLGPNPSAQSNAHPAFSCFRMTREVWDKVGPFDEQFAGAYCEDLDYDSRMRQAGIVAVSISVPFLHYGCGTILNADPVEKHRVNQFASANRKRYTAKWGVPPGGPVYQEFLEKLCPSPGEDVPLTFSSLPHTDRSVSQESNDEPHSPDSASAPDGIA